jgi:hypothetical protein
VVKYGFFGRDVFCRKHPVTPVECAQWEGRVGTFIIDIYPNQWTKKILEDFIAHFMQFSNLFFLFLLKDTLKMATGVTETCRRKE